MTENRGRVECALKKKKGSKQFGKTGICREKRSVRERGEIRRKGANVRKRQGKRHKYKEGGKKTKKPIHRKKKECGGGTRPPGSESSHWNQKKTGGLR